MNLYIKRFAITALGLWLLIFMSGYSWLLPDPYFSVPAFLLAVVVTVVSMKFLK